MDESSIWYAEPFTVDCQLPSLPLRPMKSCLKLVSSLLQLPTGTRSRGISLTRRQGDALGVCDCVCYTDKCTYRHLGKCCCIFYMYLSVQVNWEERTRPSSQCCVWKISSNPQAPLLRCWTGSEQVVICLYKYKHGQNNERCFIS